MKELYCRRKLTTSRYDDNLLDVMWTYSSLRGKPLSEIEVFAGAPLGRLHGAQSKRAREAAKSMRDRFSRDIENFSSRIRYGDNAEKKDATGALPRTIACFQIALRDENMPGNRKGLVQSFAYLATALCLTELKKECGNIVW